MKKKNDDVKDFLWQYKGISRKIAKTREEIIEFETFATHITSQMSGLPKAKYRIDDKMANNITRLSELRDKLNNLFLELSEKQTDILNIIYQIPNPYAEVIKLKYLDDKAYKDISKETGYELQTIYNQHRYCS